MDNTKDHSKQGDFPKFDPMAAFAFIKEKEGREPPALYKLFFSQELLSEKDFLDIRFREIKPYVLQNFNNPYLIISGGWTLTIKDALELPQKIRLSSHFNLRVKMPHLKKVGRISTGVHTMIDLSHCEGLEEIKKITTSSFPFSTSDDRSKDHPRTLIGLLFRRLAKRLGGGPPNIIVHLNEDCPYVKGKKGPLLSSDRWSKLYRWWHRIKVNVGPPLKMDHEMTNKKKAAAKTKDLFSDLGIDIDQYTNKENKEDTGT